MNASACPIDRQQDVAARLVRLRLDRDPQVVAALEDVRPQDVEGLLEPAQRVPDVLRGAGLRAVAPTPRDEDLRAELGGQVHLVGGLADREAAYVAVVVGEATVAEHRVREQVRRHHRHDDARLVQRLPERLERRLLLRRAGVEGEDVVVVERDPVGTELGELVHRGRRVERRTHGSPEHVHALPADRSTDRS